MKNLAIILTLLALVGCGTLNPFNPPPALELHVSKDMTTGDSEVHLITQYELAEGGSAFLNKDTGTYEIVLNSATTKDTEAGLFGLVTEMMRMMMQVYGIAPPVPPATE